MKSRKKTKNTKQQQQVNKQKRQERKQKQEEQDKRRKVSLLVVNSTFKEDPCNGDSLLIVVSPTETTRYWSTRFWRHSSGVSPTDVIRWHRYALGVYVIMWETSFEPNTTAWVCDVGVPSAVFIFLHAESLEYGTVGVITVTIYFVTLFYFITRCSAIAERPRCRVRYSFRQKKKTGTGRQYVTDSIGLSSTTVI